MKVAKPELPVLDPAEIALRRKELRVMKASGPAWALAVLGMGARELNRMIKQLQLTKDEVADLKNAVRRFKQNEAQKRYRQRKEENEAAAALLP